MQFGGERICRKRVTAFHIRLAIFAHDVKANLLLSPPEEVLTIWSNDSHLTLRGEPSRRSFDHRTSDSSGLVAAIYVRASASCRSFGGFINPLQNWRLFAEGPFKVDGDSGLGVSREQLLPEVWVFSRFTVLIPPVIAFPPSGSTQIIFHILRIRENLNTRDA